jgi:hypothetical protein
MAVFVGKPKRLLSGLYGRFFNTYFSDNMNNLSSPNHASPPDIRTQLSSSIIPTSQTWLFRGYFNPDVSSASWKFRTNSDDASYVWIGANSEPTDTSLNVSDAIVDNGGTHSAQTRTSGQVSLTAGVFYPFAVVIGNNTGPGTLTLEWQVNNGSWSSDGAGYLFHNPYAQNGYNLE